MFSILKKKTSLFRTLPVRQTSYCFMHVMVLAMVFIFKAKSWYTSVTNGNVSIYTYIYICIYISILIYIYKYILQYITLHYIPLQYNTMTVHLQYIYSTVHYTT